MFDVIAFDADDTLWHTEHAYVTAQETIAARLSGTIEPEAFKAALLEQEIENLEIYGYGAKSFALSLIETTLDVTNANVRAADIQAILATVRRMLTADVELLDHVEPTVKRLSRHHELMVLTKGDLLEQRSKLARSGLAGYFRYVEVVSHKTPASYEAVLAKYGLTSKRFLMVGNSLKSDVLPVLAVGGYAVHVPADLLWEHEHAEQPPEGHDRLYVLAHLGELPALIKRLS